MPPVIHTTLIFVHVCSVIGLFVAIGLEAAAVYRLGSTRAMTVVRENLATLAILEKALPGAAALVLVSGLGMVLRRWGWMRAWIDSALVIVALLGVLGVDSICMAVLCGSLVVGLGLGLPGTPIWMP
jgi:hypothetical protein